MTKIDLITGFLGSGKTTFILRYAKYLKAKGERIAVLENDYGAVNIDTLLLSELEDESCEIEAVAGGCDHDCHVRRFRTKLIALGMQGFDRVIVEPSGIFDVDEFFDVLHEEPLDRWYEIGNVVTVMDVYLPENELSRDARYFLLSETAQAGIIVLSHVQDAARPGLRDVSLFVNGIMEEFGCGRRFTDADIMNKEWSGLSVEDYERILSCGYCLSDHIKLPLENENGFSSLYFMNHALSVEMMEKAAAELMRDRSFGDVFRVKGFHFEDGRWYELNASGGGISVKECGSGQEVFIVVGENLMEDRIKNLFEEMR